MRQNSGCLVGAITIAVAALILGVAGWHMEYGTEHRVTFTIKSLDDQANGNSGHKYLIFTTDGRAYEDTDAWLHGKTDSSNLWALFSPGQTWDCPVYGYRNTVLSSYQDILDGCRQVSAQNSERPQR
jgi:hypothetical protein